MCNYLIRIHNEGAGRQMFLVSSTGRDFVLCRGGEEIQDATQGLSTGKTLLMGGETFISVCTPGFSFSSLSPTMTDFQGVLAAELFIFSGI